MKTITIAVCTTVLILAGLVAFGMRYKYIMERGVPLARINLFTGDVCHMADIPNPRWQPVPQTVLDYAWAEDWANIKNQVYENTHSKTLAPWGSRIEEPTLRDQVESENKATNKWNAAHNAGLQPTILVWVCQ